MLKFRNNNEEWYYHIFNYNSTCNFFILFVYVFYIVVLIKIYFFTSSIIKDFMRIGTVFILVTDIFLGLHKCLTHYCCSVAQSWPTFCDPMEYSMPGLPVPRHLLKFDQVHVHCISNAFQPSHPLVPSSPSAVNLSQHQGFSSELCVPVG